MSNVLYNFLKKLSEIKEEDYQVTEETKEKTPTIDEETLRDLLTVEDKDLPGVLKYFKGIKRQFHAIPEYEEDFANGVLHLPRRQTPYSAGYDFEVAEDTVIPTLQAASATVAKEVVKYTQLYLENHPEKELEFMSHSYDEEYNMKLVDEVGEEYPEFAKEFKKLFLPTLVPTGVCAEFPTNEVLQLHMRSSSTLKQGLMMANSTGIIDSDYINADNHGHIHFMVYNVGMEPVTLKKGDRIGQGIFQQFLLTTDDNPVEGERVGGFGSTSK